MSSSTTISLKVTDACCPICGMDGGALCARGRDFEYETSEMEFSFAACEKCEVLYLTPRPAVSELGRIYPKAYAPYKFNERHLVLRLRRRLEERKVLGLSPFIPMNADVLDAGCGGVAFLQCLRRCGDKSWRLWGNDISDDVLVELERNGFHSLAGRFEHIDMADESFDVIMFKQVIEHLESPRTVIANAARMLRRGGRLILETPNTDSWDAQLFRGRYWGGYHFPRHWTLFNRSSLAALGKNAGLELENVTYMLSPSFWVQSVHHCLKDRSWPRWVYGFFSHLNPLAMTMAVVVDELQLLANGRTSNMRIIFRKPQERS